MRVGLLLTIGIVTGLLIGCGQNPSSSEHLFQADAAGPLVWEDAGDPGDGAVLVPSRRTASGVVLASFRFESFASSADPARYQLGVASVGDSQIKIEGPFADGDAADAVKPGEGPALLTYKFDRGAEQTRTFEVNRPGVYRILPQPAKPLLQAVTLKFECTQHCSRKALSLTQIREHLRGDLKQQNAIKVALISALIKKSLRDLSGRSPWGAKVAERLERDFLSDQPIPELLVPEVSELKDFLPALEGMETDPLRGDTQVRGDLAELLGPCEYDRKDEGKPVHPTLPEVRYGHYNSQALSRCELAHSVKLARILTALSLNGIADRPASSVTLPGGKVINTSEALFQYLLDSGHHIEMRHERTYANFLSLKLPGNTESRIPLWIDTGIKLSDGSPFVIPMGHSQAAWRIWGPQVRARVAVFLGISGAGFYPQTDFRPAWTGLKRLRSYLASDEKGLSKIRENLKDAARYLRRNHIERKTLPADGYAIVGVCNDSTAIIENETPIPYPLMRQSAFNTLDLDDGLSSRIAKLPHDTDIITETLSGAALESRRKSIFCRALNMSPHAPESPQVWDPRLQIGLKEAAIAAPQCFK